MISTFKLHWTSMNEPLNNIAHYWELGVVFDFHCQPSNRQGKDAIDLLFDINEIKEKKSKFIVTHINDSQKDENNHPRFFITAYVFKNGNIEGEPIKIGYRTPLCHQACWLEKVDCWMIKITDAKEIKYVNEHHGIYIEKNN